MGKIVNIKEYKENNNQKDFISFYEKVCSEAGKKLVDKINRKVMSTSWDDSDMLTDMKELKKELMKDNGVRNIHSKRNDIRINDIVCLNSGGPEMIVKGFCGEWAECVWDDYKKTDIFNINSLSLIKR